MFNLDSLTWRRGLNIVGRFLASAAGDVGCVASDSLGHSGENGNGYRSTPDGDQRDGTFGSWTTLYPKKVQSADHNTMAIDPVRDIIGVDCQRRKCALCARTRVRRRENSCGFHVRGDQPVLAEFAALEYAPNLHRFVYFSAKNGPRLYSITEPDGSSWPQLTNGAWKWRCILDPGNRLDPIAACGNEYKVRS